MARGFNYKLTKAFGATEHVMTVLSVRDITPSFRRIRVHAPTMIDGRETPTASFIRMWARDLEDPEKMQQRGYTLIDPDPTSGEVSFDFVLHQPAGPAGFWAANAKPGDTITASYMSFTKFEVPDPEPEGYLLLGDPSAIPAINAILKVLPRDAQIVVILEIITDGDETIPISEHPGATVTWVPKHIPSRLGKAIPQRDWSNWYAWLAGESKTVKDTRALLNTLHGFPLPDIEHRAYWMRGKAMRLAKEREAKELEKAAGRAEPSLAAAKTIAEQPAGRWRSERGKELLGSIRWKLRVAGVMQAFISIMQLAPYVLLAEIGRRLLDGQTGWGAFRAPVLGALISFGGAALLSAALMVWLHTVDAGFGRDLRRSVVTKLARLPLGWFSDRNSASVRQAVQEDAGRLHYMVTHAVPDSVAGAVTPDCRSPLSVYDRLWPGRDAVHSDPHHGLALQPHDARQCRQSRTRCGLDQEGQCRGVRLCWRAPGRARVRGRWSTVAADLGRATQLLEQLAASDGAGQSSFSAHYPAANIPAVHRVGRNVENLIWWHDPGRTAAFHFPWNDIWRADSRSALRHGSRPRRTCGCAEDWSLA
jgi:ATP-binding cassette subfamily B protein IrtA